MLQSQHLLSPNFAFSLPHPQNPSPLFFFFSPHSPSNSFPSRPTTAHSVSPHLRARPESWLALAQLPDSNPPEDEGPIEIFDSTPSIFADDDNPSTLQVATSVLLTGAVSVFLFRSLRRRARRAKELKFRSTGAKKSLKEEAMDNLKAMAPAPVDANTPPSPVQALLGAISAGVIALILYKFTTTIEASLNRQTLSDNFSNLGI